MVPALALIALLGLALPVEAALIEVRFTGQVTELGDVPIIREELLEEFAGLGIAVGTPVVGRYTLRSTDLNSSPNVGWYSLHSGLRMSIGSRYVLGSELFQDIYWT